MDTCRYFLGGWWVNEWINEWEVIRLCLNLSLFVFHTVPAPAGIRALPRPVPGAASMPGGSRWDLLWRPVPHPGKLPVGAVPVPGRWVLSKKQGIPLFLHQVQPHLEQREEPPMGADLCAKRLPDSHLIPCSWTPWSGLVSWGKEFEAIVAEMSCQARNKKRIIFNSQDPSNEISWATL